MSFVCYGCLENLFCTSWRHRVFFNRRTRTINSDSSFDKVISMKKYIRLTSVYKTVYQTVIEHGNTRTKIRFKKLLFTWDINLGIGVFFSRWSCSSVFFWLHAFAHNLFGVSVSYFSHFSIVFYLCWIG